MVFRLIHVSDLHRTSDDPLTNDELIVGIRQDVAQLAVAEEDFRAPDAIVVSGDLVQGVRPGDGEYPDSLRRQNQEALEFLVQLTDDFLDGDRSRMVVLPGNHDVDRTAALSGMEVIDDLDAYIAAEGLNLAKELAKPNTPYRWCWRSRTLRRINDKSEYDKKLSAYREVVDEFYKEVSFQVPFDSSRLWNHFVFNDEIAITAFDNCRNIDGFHAAADIPPKEVAQATRALHENGVAPRLRIAAWHHHTLGRPLRSDYLDAADLNMVVNSGYRLGLHGHCHRPDVLPHSIYTSSRHEMAVISVGSLGASDAEMPPGCRQQFNLIRINDDLESARLWVREMISRGVFGGGTIRHRTNRNYFDVRWTKAPEAQVLRTNAHGGAAVRTADRIEELLAASEAGEALMLLDSVGDDLGDYGRSLRIRALYDLAKWDSVISLIDKPTNADEVHRFYQACLATKEFDKATNMIIAVLKSALIDEAMGRELLARINAERKVS